MLHLSKESNIKNALEALRLQFRLVERSPAVAPQLKWSRFVNTRGCAGSNIPSDLFIEDLNKGLKESIKNMGTNWTEKAVRLASKSVSMIKDIANNFDLCTRGSALNLGMEK